MRAALALGACALWACAGVQNGANERAEVQRGALDPAPFLAESARAARAAGAGELQPVTAMVVSEGEQVGNFVRAPTASCLLALARPAGNVRDVDLFVYSDGGDRLASDEAPEADAAVLVCPPHPRRLFVAARVMAGAGILALGVMLVPRDKADRVARAVGARGRPGQDTGKLAAWPGLERKVRERRASLGSSWDDIRRVAMHVDPLAPAAVSVPIDAGRCLDVLVTPSDELQSIDATVVNEDGRIVARGRPPGRDRTFVLCSASSGTLTIVVRPRMSSGLVAMVVGRSAPGAGVELNDGSWVDAVSPIAPIKDALERHAKRTAGLGMRDAHEVGRVNLEVGAPRSIAVALKRGCTRIDAVGGAPLGAFTAELWTDDGRRLFRARGGESAAMFYCGPAMQARVELAAGERPGPIALMARLDDKAPAALLDRGAAASLLLGRLDAAAGPIAPRDAAAARAIELSAEGRHSETVDAPANSCVDVVAALDGAARGLILVAADRRARGERVTAERICAGTQARQIRLELTGSGYALLLVRRAPD